MQRILVRILVIWASIALMLLLLAEVLHVAPLQFWYYPALLGGVGLLMWLNRQRMAEALQNWRLPPLPKFLLLGYGMVLLEEVLAALFNHLTEGFAWGLYLERIGQFWALNVLAFTGFIVGWYLLQRWLRFTFVEVFFVAGLWGLYAEHTYLFVLVNPIAFFVIAPLNILTYGLIISPATLSLGKGDGRELQPIFKYPLAVVTLFVCSIIPIVVLQILRAHFPQIFPPRKFVS